ncbi:MAG: ABC transporter permease [Acidobacteria bacterium]|jgi:ribose transport system permease protein|nr:ABC transporter permease [Acidobacteriota bacterium]
MTTRSIVERAGTFVGLVLVAIIFGALVGPQFFAPTNLELMARQMAIVSIAAVGMTIVIVSGGIDLSVGSMIALCTVAIAQLLRMDVSPLLAAVGGIAVAAVCGLINGVLITQLRVVPFIVTLGTMLVIRGAAKGLGEERRIEAPATWLNDLLRVTRGETLLPSGIWAVIALSIVVAALLRYTRFGRHVFALGSNERMARLCGVAITRTKVVVYTLSAALVGFAGLLQFSKLSVGDPTVAVGLELDVIAAVIIGGGSLSGGRGTVAGTLIGAAIMTVIQIGCSQKGLANWVQQIVTGGIIVAAVALDRIRSQRATA